MILFFGIDPGLSGCLIVLDHSGRLVGCHDFPSLKSGGRRELLVPTVARTIRDYVDQVGPDQIFCMLEKHTPRPGQGISSQCKSARIAGQLEGIVAGLGVSYELTHPATWSKVMRDVEGPDKKTRSVLAASRRWPDLDLSRKKDHNRADAALIAEYGRQRLSREQT